MLPFENVQHFRHKPKHFSYFVCVNDNDYMSHPDYHRTSVIIVRTGYGGLTFYSKAHFMNYLKYWKISIDSLPTNFAKAINNLCATPEFLPPNVCKYSNIKVNL